MWVPLVENYELDSPGTDYFVEKNILHLMQQDPELDTVVLGCTHYPFLISTIRKYLPEKIKLIDQGPVVAEKLEDYLFRHPEIEIRLSKNSITKYETTETAENFTSKAALFLGEKVEAATILL
jgi:glutamate racemase